MINIRNEQRPASMSSRKPYPSDLTDVIWRRVDGILRQSPEIPQPRVTITREVMNAINYRWQTGCVWRMLPHDFPRWTTVYAFYQALQKARVLHLVREAIQTQVHDPVNPVKRRGRAERNPDWEMAQLDGMERADVAGNGPIETQDELAIQRAA